MIDWKKHPKATRASICYWIDDMLIANEEFDRPTQKTVADAVDEHKSKWPFSYGITFIITRMGYSPKHEHYFGCGDDYELKDGEYYVCTRAEFEAYVKEQGQPHFKATRENLEKIAKDAQCDFVEVEQEGEKWTHAFEGDKCFIKVPEPDSEGFIIIFTEKIRYIPCRLEILKPIKPTISEAEAFRLCLKSEVSAYYVMNRYNVEEVPAND